MTLATVRYCGIECYSLRDTLSVGYAGGGSLALTNADTTHVQRVTSRPNAVQGTLRPVNNTDRPTLVAALNLPDVQPIILPDGTRYPIRLDRPQQSGWQALGSDTYQISGTYEPAITIADVFWRGMSYGARSTASIIPSYLTAGSPTLISNTGYRLVGTGLWGGAFISFNSLSEDTVVAQPQMIADLDIEAGSVVAVGLSEKALMIDKSLINGVGVLWTGSVSTIDDQALADNSSSVPGGTAGRYKVIITARLGGARVEVWRGTEKIMFVNNVPFRGIGDMLGPIIHVRSGAATIRRWWVRGT